MSKKRFGHGAVVANGYVMIFGSNENARSGEKSEKCTYNKDAELGESMFDCITQKPKLENYKDPVILFKVEKRYCLDD